MDTVIKLLVKFFQNFYKKGKEETFKEALQFFASFVDFQTFADWLIYKLSDNTKLSDNHKEFIFKNLEKVWKSFRGRPQVRMVSGIIPDEKAISIFTEMTSFYMGEFFKGDEEVKRRALSFLMDYYLKEGNPIGRGQKGIKEFLDRFGDYLDRETEIKARQIIDTTVNMMRNSARIVRNYEAGIKYTVWDATNDRLTCKACRSMDGRIIKTEEAYSQFKEIAENPENLPKVRPILTKPWEGKTEDCPVKFPPMHPLCRCRAVPYVEKEKIPFHPKKPKIIPYNDLQLKLESFVKNLKTQEINNRYRALLGAEWVRTPEQKRNLLKHFEKHSTKLGVKTLHEYKELAHKILENPDRVYLQRYNFVKPKGRKVEEKMDWIVEKGNLRLVVEDDTLLVKTVHKIEENEDEFLRRAEKRGVATLQLL